MKKFLLGIAVIAGFATLSTSCGGCNDKCVDNDTIVSKQTCDSLSVALGKFMGINLQDEVRYLPSIDEYIEGYQLIAGHKYTPAKLMGIRAAIRMAEQFTNMEAEGVNVNRDLFMRQFRNYLQDFDMNQVEYALVYKEVQDLYQTIDRILEKREQMRRGEVDEVMVVEEAEGVIPTDSLDVFEEETNVVEVAVDNEASSPSSMDESEIQPF